MARNPLLVVGTRLGELVHGYMAVDEKMRLTAVLTLSYNITKGVSIYMCVCG